MSSDSSVCQRFVYFVKFVKDNVKLFSVSGFEKCAVFVSCEKNGSGAVRYRDNNVVLG